MVQLELNISKIIILYNNEEFSKDEFEKHLTSFSKDELVKHILDSNSENNDYDENDKLDDEVAEVFDDD